MAEVLAVIAARGGSKTLPGKNVAPFGGKPLIGWTIEAAFQSKAVRRTIVTTDDAVIARTAIDFGAEVPFVRPPELARDETPGVAAVLHAVEWLEQHQDYRPDIVVNLQPTSPLRHGGDIDAAIAQLSQCSADAVVSVTAVDSHPFWMKTIDTAGFLHDFVNQAEPTLNRQSLPPVFALNGAIYLAHRTALLTHRDWYGGGRTAAYVMPFERSVDIDTRWDFLLAEMLLKEAQ